MSQVIQSGNQYILFNEAYLTSEDCVKFFASGFSNNQNIDSVNSQGRGEVQFFRCEDHSLVAKHYLRGGLLSHIVHDQYYGCKPETTRAFREWRLLAMMREKGLPVPVPVVAHVAIKHCCYRADLITVQIEAAKTLAQYLTQLPLNLEAWQAVGVCIKRFHRANIFHADLNANNILINQQQELFVLDFDKGAIKSGELWKLDNIERLKRSLLKFKRKTPNFHFEFDHWRQLIRGYIAS
ncbi:MAG: 3-deoxy-D-manno-octulosonic acid kinase [Gammaproteobacteria bacterium]|nr:3-deoxy-D-manno-octulosonic acid kinase [Gammaproteobacteria bacterium]